MVGGELALHLGRKHIDMGIDETLDLDIGVGWDR